MKEYKVIHAFGHLPLAEEVNKAIKDGWQPLGGVTFSKVEFPQGVGAEIIWAQAMGR